MSSLTLDEIVPWGRSFREYRAMFALDEMDLGKRILGVGDGPAGFIAELARRDNFGVSVDPLYAFSAGQIRERIEVARAQILELVQRNRDAYVWTHIKSVEDLDRTRTEAMEAFLADYERGRAEGRYLDESLPELPFSEDSFDIALCSHLLFLYSAALDERFHLVSIREMIRVAVEVRIFPLTDLGGERSPHLDSVLAALEHEGFTCEIISVDYEFLRGANEMLRVSGGPKPLG